eukprot:COSAG02_NODE_2670_length_8288_cov_6.629792_7_plen_153_part_00
MVRAHHANGFIPVLTEQLWYRRVVATHRAPVTGQVPHSSAVWAARCEQRGSRGATYCLLTIILAKHQRLSRQSIDIRSVHLCVGCARNGEVGIERIELGPVLSLGSYLPWFLTVKMTGKKLGEAIFPRNNLLSSTGTGITKIIKYTVDYHSH